MTPPCTDCAGSPYPRSSPSLPCCVSGPSIAPTRSPSMSHYVRDAVSQLAHGYPTAWPDDDPALGGERARAFLDAPAAIAHPPLGKWLIGLGILLFARTAVGT